MNLKLKIFRTDWRAADVNLNEIKLRERFKKDTKGKEDAKGKEDIKGKESTGNPLDGAENKNKKSKRDELVAIMDDDDHPAHNPHSDKYAEWQIKIKNMEKEVFGEDVV